MSVYPRAETAKAAGQPETGVPAQPSFPELEEGVLAYWAENDTFQESIRHRPADQDFVFYDGPPFANGLPHYGHLITGYVKDVVPRFRTMQGKRVDRRFGWDCHGLPAEVEAERLLGISGKAEIVAMGIEKFNEACRDSVLRYTREWREYVTRQARWVDFDHDYKTLDLSYMESVMWAFRQLWDKGLIYQGFKVLPYCWRCETPLSNHELRMDDDVYVDRQDPSVTVRFRLETGEWLLAWTTTPWTLPSNTAVAVHPEVGYLAVSDGDETLVVAGPLLEKALGEGWKPTGESFTGREMERWTYQRPFELIEFPADVPAHYVVLADYVTTEDGTGLVHQSPAFGADDLKVCRGYGLPVVNPVRPDGTFEESVPLIGGVFFKKADEKLVADMRERGILFRHLEYEHSYPHCWRCHTALLYYAQPSWYIRTTAVKDALLRENEATNWYPENVKHGRFGDWLNNNIDWALSRSRYWGTPLPIWRCAEGHLTCVGSLAELGALAGRDLADLDPHRPFIDEVTFGCPSKSGDEPCGKTAERVPEVIDCWYDAGSMPFAQLGYPHQGGSVEELEAAYPADFICEAIDQTRGWFYTLMAIGTLVFDQSSYKNVLCLGHIMAEDGRKMSKHLGNILEPMPLMDRHGADPLRWFMLAGGSPWSARRVGDGTIQEVVRKTLLTYWNTVAFHVLYARTGDWTPSASDPAPEDRPVLDRWVLSELNRLVRDVDAALENFDTQATGKLLADYVDDLSNWYVRRSRRRFWKADPAALATLHTVLETLTKLMAPLVPFITERVWQDVVRPVTPDAPESVHLAAWPVADAAAVDDRLAGQMALVRRLVELGRATRAESGVKTRQLLGRALVGANGWGELDAELRAQVAEELNVESTEALSEAAGDLLQYSAKGNFRALGKRFAKRTPLVANAIAAADAAELAAALRSAGTASVTVEGEPVEVTAEEVIVTETPKEGWAVATAGGETVALDLTITPELRLAGVARDAVRLIQEARKTSGLDVSDRIVLHWHAADAETGEALTAHQSLIADEVLAVRFVVSDGSLGESAFRDEELGLEFTVEKA